MFSALVFFFIVFCVFSVDFTHGNVAFFGLGEPFNLINYPTSQLPCRAKLTKYNITVQGIN